MDFGNSYVVMLSARATVKIFSTFTSVSAVFYCLKIKTENTIFFTSYVKNKNLCLQMLFKICLGGEKMISSKTNTFKILQ